MRRGIGRPGRGLVGTMATTAVVVGTARATSNAMDRHAQGKQDEAMAQQAAIDSQTQVQQQQAEMEQMQQQMAAMQAQQAQAAMQIPAPAPAAAPAPDMMAQLTQLTQMKAAGMITDEEFQAAKAKLLAG